MQVDPENMSREELEQLVYDLRGRPENRQADDNDGQQRQQNGGHPQDEMCPELRQARAEIQQLKEELDDGRRALREAKRDLRNANERLTKAKDIYRPYLRSMRVKFSNKTLLQLGQANEQELERFLKREGLNYRLGGDEEDLVEAVYDYCRALKEGRTGKYPF